jgi:hypothetical protein
VPYGVRRTDITGAIDNEIGVRNWNIWAPGFGSISNLALIDPKAVTYTGASTGGKSLALTVKIEFDANFFARGTLVAGTSSHSYDVYYTLRRIRGQTYKYYTHYTSYKASVVCGGVITYDHGCLNGFGLNTHIGPTKTFYVDRQPNDVWGLTLSISSKVVFFGVGYAETVIRASKIKGQLQW